MPVINTNNAYWSNEIRHHPLVVGSIEDIARNTTDGYVFYCLISFNLQILCRKMILEYMCHKTSGKYD